MAITGISAISGEQIIAAGAVSAKEAGKAFFTTGGNDIQNLYDTVSTNSASWTASGPSYTGDAQGALDEVYSNSADWNSAAAMNELPVSAGEGMDIQNVDGTIVFSCTGGSVPEGVLVESGLEYNAVNEISGYSGSAFAQYGADKQWLVHDDTLLHVANSAQYALGVNVSAIAQVMGVDETVLWSGNMSWGQNGYLIDSVKNYERIRFYIEETNRHRKSVNEIILTDLSNANLREFSLNLPDATTSYFGNYFTVYQINEAGDSITSVSGRQWWYSPWTSTSINGSVDRGLILTKVIGIGRKEV